MFKRIVLLVNYNMYDSKRYFTQKLAEAFERKDIKTKIIDLKEKTFEANIGKEIQQFAPDFTCSFNSFELPVEGRFPWDVLKIPHLAMLVDPALYSASMISSPYVMISCVDQFDCNGLIASQFERVFFLPHGVERELNYEKSADRSFDVVLLGSCYDYEGLRKYWTNLYPPEICRILDDAIDIVLSDRMIPLAEALVNAWNKSSLPVDTGLDFKMLFYYLDRYTRGKDRVELIRSIKNRQVYVFGDIETEHPACQKGWMHYLGSQANVTIHPGVSYSNGLAILKKSRICLNSMPFFKNGSHERVFTSLACGAVPLTTKNLYWPKFFQEGKEVLFYKSGDWSGVENKIEALLSNEAERKEVAAAGRETVMAHHTWDHRVEELLHKLQGIKRP